ncbi:MAG: DUF3037 domain-containing protein [Bacteroidota bacterium]
MQEKQVYEYAVIKVMPRVERGECINVGVILYSKRKRFIKMLYKVDEARLTALWEDIDLQELKDYLQAWELISEGDTQGGKIGELGPAERFRWLTAVKSTVLQSSRVHPGMCIDPEKEVQKLFEKFVS